MLFGFSHIENKSFPPPKKKKSIDLFYLQKNPMRIHTVAETSSKSINFSFWRLQNGTDTALE